MRFLEDFQFLSTYFETQDYVNNLALLVSFSLDLCSTIICHSIELIICVIPKEHKLNVKV